SSTTGMTVDTAIASVATTVTSATMPTTSSRWSGSSSRGARPVTCLLTRREATGSAPRNPSPPVLSTRAPGSAGHVLGHEVPVHEVVEPGRDVVRPGVAEVDVVGVLPHVEGEQRLRTVLHRQVRVRGLHDLEPRPRVDQPGPAGAELGGRGLRELVAELLVGAERRVD